MTPRRRKMKYLDESRQPRCRRMGADTGVLIRALSDGPATALTGGSLLARRWNLAERASSNRQDPAGPHRRPSFRDAGLERRKFPRCAYQDLSLELMREARRSPQIGIQRRPITGAGGISPAL